MAEHERRKKRSIIQASGPGETERDAQVGRSERMFDPYLTSDHKLVRALADNLTTAYEQFGRSRKRRMKARDRENIHTIFLTIAANLAYVAAEGIAPPVLGVSLRAARRKLTRYDRRGFTGLPKILQWFSEGGMSIRLTASNRKGIASTITINPQLAKDFGRFKYRPEHFSYVPGRETIYLTRIAERDFIDGSKGRELVDYEDTAESRAYRREMEEINAALAAADITMVDDGGLYIVTSLRQLRRAFVLPPDVPQGSVRFDLGGRLFGARGDEGRQGGWWQSLPKERRAAIRIDGEPVADLDFASMFLRLAYTQIGMRPPEGDLYAAVQALSEARWREGVKKVTNALFFRTAPLTRLPKDTKSLLPPGASAPHVRSAILAAHPALAPVFESGIGLHLMFRESQVLVATLLRLIEKRIPALPMHDGLMVARSKADTAARIMKEASEAVTGFPLPISLKAQY